MSSVDQFAAKMEKTARAIEGATRDGVNEAAAVVGLAVDAGVATVLGSDRAFSGIPGAKVGALVKKARAVRNPQAIVQATPAGLASIVESGAKPHVVGARTAKGKRVRNIFGLEDGGGVVTLSSRGLRRARTGSGALMRLPDGMARGPFIAGGFKATHAVSRAFDLMAPRVAPIVHRETWRAVGRSFR